LSLILILFSNDDRCLKVQVAALNFFLGNNQSKEDDKDSDSDDVR